MTCLLALENTQLTDEVTMTATGVSGGCCDGSERLILDGGLHDQRHVVGRSVLVVIRKSGGIREYGIGTSKLLRSGIHLLDKAVYRTAYMLCNLQCNIIGRGNHNGMTLISVVLKGASGQTAPDAASILNYGFDQFVTLSLGDSDFSIISGGDVVVPAGTGADSLTTEDSQNGDQIDRTYLFNGISV